MVNSSPASPQKSCRWHNDIFCFELRQIPRKMPSMLRIERYADREIDEVELHRLPKLVLPFDLRRKSRLRTRLANGTEAALFLPRGSVLRDGDLLESEDGT